MKDRLEWLHEGGCSAAAGTSHQSRTGAAAGSDAAVEALRGMTVLVRRTLADSELPPAVIKGLAAHWQLPADSRNATDFGDSTRSSTDALAALRRMAVKASGQDAADANGSGAADPAPPQGQMQ